MKFRVMNGQSKLPKGASRIHIWTDNKACIMNLNENRINESFEGRKIRHSASHELSQRYLENFIKDLVKTRDEDQSIDCEVSLFIDKEKYICDQVSLDLAYLEKKFGKDLLNQENIERGLSDFFNDISKLRDELISEYKEKHLKKEI